jgi:hypothetical protein
VDVHPSGRRFVAGEIEHRAAVGFPLLSRPVRLHQLIEVPVVAVENAQVTVTLLASLRFDEERIHLRFFGNRITDLITLIRIGGEVNFHLRLRGRDGDVGNPIARRKIGVRHATANRALL